MAEAAAKAATVPGSAPIQLYKNNTDNKGASYGSHENYLMRRGTPFADIVRFLVPFFVSRQVICGAGRVGIGADGRGSGFQISQRADFFEVEVGLETTLKRPIINTRDEPHADAERFRRLHVIVGDSNMSETTTLLKVGSTDLVLRMIEAGAMMRDLTLDNAIRAIREVSHDMTGRSRVRLANGRELSALDIQYEYLNRAKDFTTKNGADPVSKRVLDMWERALSAIETGNLDMIAREIDWVTKYQLIERYRARHDLPLSSPRVAQLDLAYHDVHRGRGLYYLLQRAGAVER